MLCKRGYREGPIVCLGDYSTIPTEARAFIGNISLALELFLWLFEVGIDNTASANIKIYDMLQTIPLNPREYESVRAAGPIGVFLLMCKYEQLLPTFVCQSCQSCSNVMHIAQFAHLSMCNPMPCNAHIYARHRFFVLHPTRQLANRGGGGDEMWVVGGAKPRAAPPSHLRQVLKRAKLSLGRGNPPKGGRIWNINRWQMLYHLQYLWFITAAAVQCSPEIIFCQFIWVSRTRYIFLNLNISNILEQIFHTFFQAWIFPPLAAEIDFQISMILLPIGNWQSGLVQDCMTRPENRLKQIQRKSLQGFKYVRAQYACFGYHVSQLINKIWARNPDNKQFNSVQ